MAYFLHVHALLLFTADILLSFSEHPPLKLPAAGFVLDLENGPTDQSFDDYLEAIKKAINPGNQNEIHQSSTCTLNSVRQWNLDLTNLYNEVLGITNDFLQPGQNYSTVEPRYNEYINQGTGKICSLYRGFVIWRFFFIYFTITGVKKIVSYTEHFVISRFHCKM